MTQPTPPTRSARTPRRALLIGGVTAALLIAAWAGSTAYSGQQARATSDELARTVDTRLKSSQLGRVVSHTHSAGFASSTDDLIVELGPQGVGKPVQVHLRNHIQHGPLPGLSGVGQASVDTEIVWDAKTQAALDQAFGGKKPVIHTLIGLGGDSHTTVQVPAGVYAAADASGGTATWQALSGQFDVGSGGRAVTGQLVWPGATLKGQDAAETMTVGELRLTMNQQPYLKALSTGKSTLTLAGVTLPEGIGALKNLRIESSTTGSGNAMRGQTVATLAQLNIPSFPVTDVRLVLSASKLDSAALEQLAGVARTPEYQRLSSGVGQASEAEVRQLLGLLTPGLEKLLAGNPQFSVDEVSAKTPQGQAKVKLSAQIVNGQSIRLAQLTQGGAEQLMGLLANLKLSADIQGDEALIGGLLASSGNQTAAGLASSLDPMIQQGLIKREGKTIKTHLELDQNGPTINGKKMQ